MVCKQRWDRVSQLRLLFLPAMYGVDFRRRQLLHPEWDLSKLSARSRSPALNRMPEPDRCARVRGLL
jgi:hypothetical protein